MTGTSRIVAGAITLITLVLLAASCSSGESTETAAVVEPTEVPTAPVVVEATAAPTATPEPTAEPEPTATPEPAYDFSVISPIVSEFVEDNELNGAGLVIVHKDDGVIHHEHWGVFDEDRISLIASSTKMVTAGVLLRLQEDGLLDINAPIADVAEWGTGNPDVTVAQLLSNSSGLVGLLPDPAYGPYVCQFMPTGTLQECAETIFTTEGDDEDITGPDVAFNYGGAQWQVAGGVAEAASGKSWAELIDEIYTQPCGLEHFGYNSHFLQLPSNFVHPPEFDSNPGQLTPTANPNMEGGAYTTTGDYAKLMLMHLRGGQCDGGQVLTQVSLDLMHGDRIADAYDGDAWGEDTGYGMGWWIDRSTGYISDGGAYGSVPWLDLDDGYGAFLVIEANSATGNQLADLLYEPVEAAIVGS